MSANWKRYFELVLEDKKGASIKLSDFKVNFTITLSASENNTGSEAIVSVYNLNADTKNRLIKGEYASLRIVAGYSGLGTDEPHSSDEFSPDAGQTGGNNYGQIFSGDIRYAWSGMADAGKANGIDRCLTIQAIDGHKGILETTLNTTVAAGYDINAIYTLMMKNFDPFGITAGVTGKMPETRFPRGRVLYRAAHQVIDNLAAQCQASWQIVDNKLQMVPTDNYIDRVVVLNTQTGLIGMPVLTADSAVTMTCLINPNIRLLGLVQIDQGMLRRARETSATAMMQDAKNRRDVPPDKNQEKDEKPISVAADGVYIVKAIKWTGDTRGQEWYMALTCEPRDQQTSVKTKSSAEISK